MCHGRVLKINNEIFLENEEETINLVDLIVEDFLRENKLIKTKEEIDKFHNPEARAFFHMSGSECVEGKSIHLIKANDMGIDIKVDGKTLKYKGTLIIRSKGKIVKNIHPVEGDRVLEFSIGDENLIDLFSNFIDKYISIILYKDSGVSYVN